MRRYWWIWLALIILFFIVGLWHGQWLSTSWHKEELKRHIDVLVCEPRLITNKITNQFQADKKIDLRVEIIFNQTNFEKRLSESPPPDLIICYFEWLKPFEDDLSASENTGRKIKNKISVDFIWRQKNPTWPLLWKIELTPQKRLDFINIGRHKLSPKAFVADEALDYFFSKEIGALLTEPVSWSLTTEVSNNLQIPESQRARAIRSEPLFELLWPK